jgi:hypothetical protein
MKKAPIIVLVMLLALVVVARLVFMPHSPSYIYCNQEGTVCRQTSQQENGEAVSGGVEAEAVGSPGEPVARAAPDAVVNKNWNETYFKANKTGVHFNVNQPAKTADSLLDDWVLAFHVDGVEGKSSDRLYYCSRTPTTVQIDVRQSGNVVDSFVVKTDVCL